MKRAIIYIHTLAAAWLTASANEAVQKQSQNYSLDALYVYTDHPPPSSSNVPKFTPCISTSIITPAENSEQESNTIPISLVGQVCINPEENFPRKPGRRYTFPNRKYDPSKYNPNCIKTAFRRNKIPP